MRKTFIYGLRDPRDGAMRYVGKADRPRRRLVRHVVRRHEESAKAKWVRELFEFGLRPVLEILEEVYIDAWQDAERRWIASFDGLLNAHDGGNGGGRSEHSRPSAADLVKIAENAKPLPRSWHDFMRKRRGQRR